MNRFILALPLMLAAAPALSAEATFLTNNTRFPIDDVYASLPNINTWGDDLTDDIPAGSVDPGKTSQIRFVADGTYDFRIAAPEFKEVCIIRNVPVSGGQIVFNDTMFTICKFK